MKNVLIIGLFFTLFAQAMEQENRWDITLHGTTIHVIQGDMLEYYVDENKKKDIIMCVGRNKQIELGPPYYRFNVGICDGPYKTLWFKPDKDSIHYKQAELNGWRFPGRNGISFLCIGEPQVRHERGYEQVGWRYSPGDNVHYEGGELAIAKSYDDLAMCYKKLLEEGIKVFQQQLKGPEDTKNIAFPMLGADFKFKNSYVSKEDTASIAVTAVVEFLKNKPDFYNNVEFFVEDDSDSRLYKKLLMEQCGLTEKILLFWLAYHKDSQCILTLLPRELIHYIAKLI